jgi:tripartite-type tricarboxylate transporter receptor subunit TctC
MNRRAFLASVPLLSGLSAVAFAEEWPARPISFVVPLAAGSTSDIFARFVGSAMGDALRATFIIENRPGGGGNIGVGQAARAANDGYTILLGTTAQLAINVGLFSKLPFDPLKDFTPVLPMVASFNGLIVPENSSLRSVANLAALAKSKPGVLNYSSAGVGTTHHLSAALFCAMAGIDAVHVPYRGAVDAINGVMADQISFGFFNLPNVVPLAKAGKLRVLAVTGANRSPLMPEVPTMQEAGYKDYETSVWFGVYVPVGVSDQITSKMRAALVELMGRQTFKARMEEIGFELMPIRSPAESATFLRAEIDKWGAIVKLSGARFD